MKVPGPAAVQRGMKTKKKVVAPVVTLTTANVAVGLAIVSKDNPDWGTWVVMRKYDTGVWEIRRRVRHDGTTLFESEFHFWRLA